MPGAQRVGETNGPALTSKFFKDNAWWGGWWMEAAVKHTYHTFNLLVSLGWLSQGSMRICCPEGIPESSKLYTEKPEHLTFLGDGAF